jgi:predicted metal-binding membrane protein
MDDEMPMEFAGWVGAWTVMMAAMMLPSTSPLVLLYARQSTVAGSALLLTAGYLLVWAAIGLAAYEVAMRLPDPGNLVVGAVIIGAGLYQLTRLKTACLMRCRNPVDFLVTHWRPGRAGALRLGSCRGPIASGAAGP